MKIPATHIARRPGPFLGATGRLASARLTGIAVKLLEHITLGPAQEAEYPNGRYSNHAILDVQMNGNEVCVVLDTKVHEIEGVRSRCAALLNADRSELDPDEYVGPRHFTAIGGLQILSALSSSLHIYRASPGCTEKIISVGLPIKPPDLNAAHGQSYVVTFCTLDSVFAHLQDYDPADMTEDYLRGFVNGLQLATGLVVRFISVLKRPENSP